MISEENDPGTTIQEIMAKEALVKEKTDEKGNT
jgi:hypothetical protein